MWWFNQERELRVVIYNETSKSFEIYLPENLDVMELLALSNQIHNSTIYLFVLGVPFKRNFMSVAKTILKRLFRVYAHIYHQHFDSVIQLQEEAHLNTSFKHFIFFVQVQESTFISCVDLCLLSTLLMYLFFLCVFFLQEFNLIDRKELVPLQELIEKLTTKDR